MKIKAYLFLLALLINVVANFIWEKQQAFLYKRSRFSDHFFRYLNVSLANALVTLLIYLLVALIYKDLPWTKYNSWMPVGIIGGIVAVVFEKWTFTQPMWNYRESMPVVPFVGVGLSPFIQLVVLPAFIFYLSSVLLNYFVLIKYND